MMTFRATCIIHCSVGRLVIPAISTFRLQMDEEGHIVGHQLPQHDLHREISHPSCCLHILTIGGAAAKLPLVFNGFQTVAAAPRDMKRDMEVCERRLSWKTA